MRPGHLVSPRFPLAASRQGVQVECKYHIASFLRLCLAFFTPVLFLRINQPPVALRITCVVRRQTSTTHARSGRLFPARHFCFRGSTALTRTRRNVLALGIHVHFETSDRALMLDVHVQSETSTRAVGAIGDGSIVFLKRFAVNATLVVAAVLHTGTTVSAFGIVVVLDGVEDVFAVVVGVLVARLGRDYFR